VLGGHVAQRAGGNASGLAGEVHVLRESEVHDARHALLVQQDVSRTEVKVQDFGCVRVLHGVEDGTHNRDRAFECEAPLDEQEARELPALDVLEHEERPPRAPPRVEDRDNVGVFQLARRPGLGRRALVVGVVQVARFAGQELDRDKSIERRIARQQYLPLRALAEYPDQFIASDAFVWLHVALPPRFPGYRCPATRHPARRLSSWR